MQFSRTVVHSDSVNRVLVCGVERVWKVGFFSEKWLIVPLLSILSNHDHQMCTYDTMKVLIVSDWLFQVYPLHPLRALR